MKNDSRLQAIIDAADEWVDADQSNRSCIILTHDEIGRLYNHSYIYADYTDLRSMLYSAFIDNDDFLRAAEEVMMWIERDKNSEPATFV